MYPLALIFFIDLIFEEGNSFRYSLPLAGIGWVISCYHNLLYYGIIPDSIAPCSQGVSCTSKQIEWMGFVTIPLLSLIAFISILIVTVVNFKLSIKRTS